MKISFVHIFIAFKKKLYNYYLKYTKELINTIVNARNGAVNLTALTDMVHKHEAGNYSDSDVRFQYFSNFQQLT